MPVCTSSVYFWVRKILSLAMAQKSLVSLWGAVASSALVAGISLVSILQADEWARVSTPARHYFSTYITNTAFEQIPLWKDLLVLKGLHFGPFHFWEGFVILKD